MGPIHNGWLSCSHVIRLSNSATHAIVLMQSMSNQKYIQNFLLMKRNAKFLNTSKTIWSTYKVTMSHSIQAEKMSPIELVNPSTYNVEGCIHAEIFVDKVKHSFLTILSRPSIRHLFNIWPCFEQLDLHDIG